MTADLSEISLRMAGRVGADGLTLAARVPALLAAVDQHAAEVREALAAGAPGAQAQAQARAGEAGGVAVSDWQPATGRQDAGQAPPVSALLGYARGFVEAAVGRGWSPRPGGGADWESLRLAAVCQLMSRAQGRAADLTRN